MDDALRLRHRMIPYLHTMNWRASRTGLPLVEPMYWGSPDIDAAYHVPNEYMFGTELLAAPITEPMDKSSRRGKADVWLPQGDWFDFFTGRRYSASSPNGRRMTVWRPLDGIPVPMQPLSEGDSINSVDNPQHLEIIVFPGADGDFTLMEDSGHYSRQITPATTAITYRWRKDGATSALTVSLAQGRNPHIAGNGRRRIHPQRDTCHHRRHDDGRRSPHGRRLRHPSACRNAISDQGTGLCRHSGERHRRIGHDGFTRARQRAGHGRLLRFAYAERRPSSADGGAAPILARMSPLPEYATGEATAARHRPMSRRTPGRQHVEARRTRS